MLSTYRPAATALALPAVRLRLAIDFGQFLAFFEDEYEN